MFKRRGVQVFIDVESESHEMGTVDRGHKVTVPELTKSSSSSSSKLQEKNAISDDVV